VGGTLVGDESGPSSAASSAVAVRGPKEERERAGLGSRTLTDVGKSRGRDVGGEAFGVLVRADKRLVRPVTVAAVRLAEDGAGRMEKADIRSGTTSEVTLETTEATGSGVVSRGRRVA
jgi:hypothetical protein